MEGVEDKMKKVFWVFLATCALPYLQKVEAGWGKPAQPQVGVNNKIVNRKTGSNYSGQKTSKEDIISIINRSENLAANLVEQDNDELVELAVRSSDRIKRIAAAGYYAYKLEPSACLFVLMCDQDPLVVDAARLACVHIANRKYAAMEFKKRGRLRHIDFGPHFFVEGGNMTLIQEKQGGTMMSEAKDASDMWQAHFEKMESDLKKFNKERNAD